MITSFIVFKNSAEFYNVEKYGKINDTVNILSEKLNSSG